MKNLVRNLKVILIRKFKDFDTFEVCVVWYDSLYDRLFIERMAFFRRIKILEVYILFWYVPCHASIPYDKYGWISEVYNVLRKFH